MDKIIEKLAEHLGWPLAGFGIGLGALIILRKQLGALIDRIKHFGKEGFTTEPPGVTQQQTGTLETQRLETQVLLQAFDSPALLQVEKSVMADLELNKLDTKGDTVRVLVRHLSQLRIYLGCEGVYRNIFGSQIALLKATNTNGGVISEENANTFYQQAIAEYPPLAAQLDSKRYFGFLLISKVLTFDNNNGRYFLTDFGRDFLAWMVRFGISEHKRL